MLRFAAEHVKDLDPDLSLAIAEARQAAASDQWTPQISQRFWGAFSRLCDLIQPVTMDCLAAANRTIAPRGWRRWIGRGSRSIAERSSERYLIGLIVLLFLILPIQLYVWTCTNLSKKIDDLLVAEKQKHAVLLQDFSKLDADTRSKATDNWTAEEKVRAAKIVTDARAVQDDLDRIDTEARFLSAISTLFRRRPDPGTQPRSDGEWKVHYQSAADRQSRTELGVLNIQEKANLIVGVLGAYILPILFGAIGAVAYVIRTISDQIKTSTFASSSPVRHVMRAALGAMAGLVVGLFSDLSTKFSLSPLAIAFLAGYGVEAVFSMFDSVIDKFRQARTTP